MRELLWSTLLVLPALAQAHPMHGSEAGFLAGASHPFTGIDHLAGILVAGALLGWLNAPLRWFMCAAFLLSLGVTHALWSPASGSGFLFGMLFASATLVAAAMVATRGFAARSRHAATGSAR